MELRTIQFDPEEPSDLSKAICDRPESDETGVWKWVIAILTIFIIAGAFIALRPSQALVEHPDYAPDVTSDIVEVDGVLYYPDGSPVRNYEQMNRYLETQ